MIRRIATALVRGLGLLTAAWTVSAYELRHIAVGRDEDRYRLSMEVTLDVPAAAAYAVFADPTQLPLINPAVREARVLSHGPAATQRWLTRLRLCAGLFCRQLRQVQEMHFEPREAELGIEAHVLPELSDLRYGHAHWRFVPCAPERTRTCLQFEAEVEPAFWVPPLIGPWLVERSLREQAMQTSAGIEARVRQLAAPPP